MKFTIVSIVLLGSLLIPALADSFQDVEGNESQQFINGEIISKRYIISGGYQILSINRQWRVAAIEERSSVGSWKTVWNYNRGFIASKVLSQGICFISEMDRRRIPRFEALPTLAEERMNLNGQGQAAREIKFFIRGPISDLQAYGSEISALCEGVTTYSAYEVNESQIIYNQGSCIGLNVLRLLHLNYCYPNNKA